MRIGICEKITKTFIWYDFSVLTFERKVKMEILISRLSFFLNTVFGKINDALYGYILIILLIAGGVYFTLRTRGAQFRLFKEQLRAVTEKPKDKNSVSSFQALMVSTASRVGTGNIIGVSSAIIAGGFGSVFWMWVIALLGGASAFVESTLAQIFKKKGSDGNLYGGPAYYIEAGLKSRPLAIAFSLCLIFTYGVGFNMLASYNLQSTFSTYGFYNEAVTPWIIGLILAIAVGYCLFGGGKRLVKVTSFLVPIMGIAYVFISLLVILLNITAIPSIFVRIFREAFDFRAIIGGFTGSCVMYGIKRGLYSNEAGIGSAPNASASADVKHPVKQGLVQVLSVFLDTIVICTATAFMCMCSGIDISKYAEKEALYVQDALASTLGGFGPVFITVAMVLFAFTTLIGNLYYVDRGIFYIKGNVPGKKFRAVYYVIASFLVFLGAGLNAGMLWSIADIAMGAMAIINIPVIFILGKYAYGALKDYEKQRKEGIEPVFKAESIGLEGKTEYWK